MTDPAGATDTDRVNVTVHPESDDDEGGDFLDALEEWLENRFGDDDDEDDDEDGGGWIIPWPFW